MALGEILTVRWDPLQFLGFCTSYIRHLGMETYLKWTVETRCGSGGTSGMNGDNERFRWRVRGEAREI